MHEATTERSAARFLASLLQGGVQPITCAAPACVLQVSSKDFFVRTLPLFDGGDDVAMVLSPQCFHNLNLHTDIFNHSNVHFWRACTTALLCRSQCQTHQPARAAACHCAHLQHGLQASWA